MVVYVMPPSVVRSNTAYVADAPKLPAASWIRERIESYVAVIAMAQAPLLW
jgi:hypothetical protein